MGTGGGDTGAFTDVNKAPRALFCPGGTDTFISGKKIGNRVSKFLHLESVFFSCKDSIRTFWSFVCSNCCH